MNLELGSGELPDGWYLSNRDAMAVRVGEKQLLENIAATRRAHRMWAREGVQEPWNQ